MNKKPSIRLVGIFSWYKYRGISRTLSNVSLREKFPYVEFFRSVLSRMWTEYGEIQSISSFSSNAGNTDQKNSR